MKHNSYYCSVVHNFRSSMCQSYSCLYIFIFPDRHGVETVASKEDEEAKLLKVMKRIEKRKRSRAKLKEKKEFQQKCIAERIKKKVKKAQIVKVPDVAEDEFIDKNLMSYESEKAPKNTEHKTESLEGYTVLGEEQSRKRPQVQYHYGTIFLKVLFTNSLPKYLP